MKTKTNGHQHDSANIPLKAASDPATQEDNVDSLIQLQVSQGRALLRQQLEHEVKEELVREFQATSAGFQATVDERIRALVTDHVREEVLPVLESTIADSATSLEASIRQHIGEDIAHPMIYTRPSQQEEQEPVVWELGSPNGTKTSVKEPPHAEDKIPSHQMQTPAETLVVTPALAQGEDDPEEYQGAVRLRVKATESIREVIWFVNTLRQKYHIRLLELVGTAKDGVDIRLALRRPLPLLEILRQIEGVTKVEVPHSAQQNDDEPLFNVQLADLVPSA
ncbi:MAG: hypothetical protein ACE1ZD_00810 [Dehalococcoidia bacterium]